MDISFCHHLSLRYSSGGEKWLINTANALVERGHSVEIYCLPYLLEKNSGVSLNQINESLNGIPYSESRYHKIRGSEITYITYHPLSWLFFNTKLPRIAGIHSHTYWFNPHPSYGILPNLANIINRFTSYFELRRFNAVHTVTNTYKINHPKVYYIPNFVDSNFFRAPLVKDVEFTVSYASRTVWQKGWDIYNIVKKSLRHKFCFQETYGEISEKDLPNFYGKSHVTLVPSRVDTFGLSIIESMLCETPVITTPLPTHKTLNLPLFYASIPSEFVEKLSQIKKLHEFVQPYIALCLDCRRSALQYDKKLLIEKIEIMFKEVVESCSK